MAFPTAVNNQITDAVTQTNAKVSGDVLPVDVANLEQPIARGLSNDGSHGLREQPPTPVETVTPPSVQPRIYVSE